MATVGSNSNDFFIKSGRTEKVCFRIVQIVDKKQKFEQMFCFPQNKTLRYLSVHNEFAHTLKNIF